MSSKFTKRFDMSTANKLPSVNEIKNLYWYDQETGIFRARFGYTNKKAWRIAGSHETKGYLQIKVGSKLYMAHRLAWMYVTGKDPLDFEMQIDHIDGNKTNNAFANLRLVTNKQNCENRMLNIRNKTGVRGVYKSGNKFIAELCHNYKRIKVGSYETLEEAANAVKTRREEFFTHAIEK